MHPCSSKSEDDSFNLKSECELKSDDQLGSSQYESSLGGMTSRMAPTNAFTNHRNSNKKATSKGVITAKGKKAQIPINQNANQQQQKVV